MLLIQAYSDNIQLHHNSPLNVFQDCSHPTQSPHNRRSAGTESHKGTTVACQLWQKQSRVQKLHMLLKQRWLAGSKIKKCNGDFLNVGQNVCRLPRPSPSKRQQVKPKMEALRRSVKEGNEKSHIFSMRD